MGMEEEGRDIDGKTGKELFLELFRLLPSAQVEDYYYNNQWQDEDITLDYDLLAAHRVEAGAEDPPSLEELELPTMPGERPAAASFVAAAPRPAPAFVPGAAKAPALQVLGLRPQPPKSAPTSAMVAAAAGGVGGPSAELRQIALFIAKWKLEATKTKLLLARLTPPRRRWVMNNFALADNGTSSTAQLERYIAQCERENSWATAESGAGAPKPLSGVKRPLTSTPTAGDPNKRPKAGGYGAPAYGAYAAPPRPAVSHMPAYGAYGTRSSPAWLQSGGAGSPSYARAPVQPARATYGGGYHTPKPAGIAPRVGGAAGSVMRPTTPKYGGGAPSKPMVAKAKAGGGASSSKPGSLIANLLRM